MLIDIDLCEDGDGLDFKDFWHDEEFVGDVFKRGFASHFPGQICCCLRFESRLPPDVSFLVGYATAGKLNEWNDRIGYNVFLGEGDRWPVLAYAKVRRDAVFRDGKGGELLCVVVRLKRFHEFVGFFVAVCEGGNGISPEQPLLAYRTAKRVLRSQFFVKERGPSLEQNFAALVETLTRIQIDIARNRPLSGLRRLLTLITSHLSVAAGFNRVIFLAPSGSDFLTAVHAHGGDCSEAWSKSVQEFLCHTVHVPADLNMWVDDRPPFNDQFYCKTVAESPLRVDLKSDCLIAHVWNAGCNLELFTEVALIDTYRIDETADLAVAECDGDSPQKLNIALRLDSDDDWWRKLRRDRTDSIGLARNELAFLVPFTIKGPKGILLLDLAYWSTFDLFWDVMPRIKRATKLLNLFGHCFEDVDFTES